MPSRLSQSLLHRLRRIAGWVNLHRWPWLRWRLRGGGTLPIGEQSFEFVDLAEPKLAWWAHMARKREWEEPVIAEAVRTLRPGDVFFDVGAFVGAFSVLASRLVGDEGRVVAFEPDPRAREILERNLAANGARNVTIVPCAVGDRDGTVRFHASADSAGHIDPEGEVEVTQVALDDFCRKHDLRPTVMKVDIEGAEASALQESAVAREARAILLEIHPDQLQARGVDHAAFLERMGPHRMLETPGGGNYTVLLTPHAAA